jgi:uncharacterized membrane protein YkvA (DUF1232 family)
MNFPSKFKTNLRIPCRNWRSRLYRDLVFVNKQVRLLSLLVRRAEVPWLAKLACGSAIAYIFSPIQLIPTFIPVVGQMDDLLVLYLAATVMRKLTPIPVLDECEPLAEQASSAQIERWEHALRNLRQSETLATS